MQWVLVTWGQLVLVFQQELWTVEGKRCRAEPGLVLGGGGGSGFCVDSQLSPLVLTPYPVCVDQLPYSDVYHGFSHSYHV